MRSDARLVIAGSRGFGRELAAWIGQYWPGAKILGFVDDFSTGPDILGTVDGHAIPAQASYVVAIGDGKGRADVGRRLEARGCQIATLVAPNVASASGLQSVKGGIFLASASIANNVRIGAYALVQGFAVIGHDVTLGEGVTVSSFAFVGGGASAGDFATLHPHAVVLPKVSVGRGAVVGAGSVAMKNVGEGVTAFGNPARAIYKAPP